MSRIVLYDGICNLCLSFVSFVKPRGEFVFITYQEADDLLKNYPAIPKDMSSVGFIDNGQVYLYSTAIMRIFSYLSFPTKALYVFWLVPWFIRDPIYRYVGRNRYKWFGKCNCN